MSAQDTQGGIDNASAVDGLWRTRRTKRGQGWRPTGKSSADSVASRGQTIALFAVLLPLLVAFLAFVYALASLYGAQDQANSTARTAALTGLSTVNGAGSSLGDSAVTAMVNRVLQANGFTTVVYTTTSVAPVAGDADLNGVYGPSGLTMGSETSSLTGTSMITVTLTMGVHLGWGTLGVSTFTIHGHAVAANCGATIIVNVPCQ